MRKPNLAAVVVADRLATLFGLCALCADRPQFIRVSYKRGSYVYRVGGNRRFLKFGDACAACVQELDRADENGDSSLFTIVRRGALHDNPLTYRAAWRAYVLALTV